MTTIHVITRDGDQLALNVQGSPTVMEVIRDGGISELLSICGGCLSCATCHVYVEPEFTAMLPPPSDDEIGLLDGVENRTEWSRLSCQLRVIDAVDGLRVTIAPEE